MVNKYGEELFTEEQALTLARNAYRNGDTVFEIEASNCALLVIDMQDEFAKPDWVPDATRKAPTIRRLTNAGRPASSPGRPMKGALKSCSAVISRA